MCCRDEKLPKYLTQTFMVHCNAMIYQQVTLSGDAEWPKVADAVIEAGLDLIVEIEITRRNKGYDYSRYDEEKAKEVRFDRVLLLRGDGTLEAAEGRLRTWTAPCT